MRRKQIRRTGCGRSTDCVSRKNCYASESVNIATSFLISTLAPRRPRDADAYAEPGSLLNEIRGRNPHNRPYILMVVDYPKEGATIPVYATEKRPLSEIATFL